MMENKALYLAEQFILYTDKNIFLTGKAGTGKTTLLHKIRNKCQKKTVVVAPTGVAAINAGGMTIHSTFQLPLTAFAPTLDFVDPELCTNRHGLATMQKIRKEKRKVIIEMELLVIDEISMVRADLLDAVDFTLRRIRKNPNPFGGVQLLVIGDLYQLAPVVRSNIAAIISRYYDTPYFFSAYAWKESNPITIELTKVYRQSDQKFISILNQVRQGKITAESLHTLNKNYTENPDKEGVITLTTHNAKADKINKENLRKLSARSHKLKAKIVGQFAESAYPIEEEIILKKGAQVMFVRNHKDGLYYNGKIGIVSGKYEEELLVKTYDDDITIRVVPEEWKNITYSVDPESKEIIEEEKGKYIQYPVKLAWAVTVHKSQGLTFEKAIVDLKSTFAPGQLYVALSRCTRLEGLILSSTIRAHNVITDQRIVQYHKTHQLDQNIEEKLKFAKERYEDKKLIYAFNFAGLSFLLEEWRNYVIDKEVPDQANLLLQSKDYRFYTDEAGKVGLTFRKQLKSLFRQYYQGKTSLEDIRKRTREAVTYFTNYLYQHVVQPLEKYQEELRLKSRLRKFKNLTQELYDEYWYTIEQLYQLTHREQKIFPDPPPLQRSAPKNDKKQKTNKAQKGETFKITLELYQEGKSIAEIAETRSLAISTIEGHFARWIKEGHINIYEVIEQKKVNSIKKILKENEGKLLTEIKPLIPIEVSYGEIRCVQAYLECIEPKEGENVN